MATEPVIYPNISSIEINERLRTLLDLKETATHYLVRTYSGATLMRPKSEIHSSWQLLRGILDDGKDTTEEHRLEQEWELAHDQRKFGSELAG